MKKLFWFIWGLPQNLVGAIMFLTMKHEAIKIQKYKDSIILFLPGNHGAVSLGMFIFFFSDFKSRTDYVIRHEYGHSIQSKILGPVYLIIGLQSLIWAGCFDWYRKKYKISYYSFWLEAWANKLGGN